MATNRLFNPRQLLTAILGSATLLLSEPRMFGSDDERFRDISEFLGSKEPLDSKLFGMKFSEFSKELNLENVEWNLFYTNFPGGEARIYHFDGFFLYVHLILLPPSAVFDRPETHNFESQEEVENPVRYVAEFAAVVERDRFSRADQRMAQLWATLDESFRSRSDRNLKK